MGSGFMVGSLRVWRLVCALGLSLGAFAGATAEDSPLPLQSYHLARAALDAALAAHGGEAALRVRAKYFPESD